MAKINNKRAMMDFFNFAAAVYFADLAALLVSHGYQEPTKADYLASLGNAKTLAAKIGPSVAHGQLEAIRDARLAKLAAERATQLAAAREAWVKGDSKAFDKITW